jgi:hypothetical protein
MDLNHPLLALADEPPPFPAAYPQLGRLDKAVVCQICKEPFVGPVSIACGHSFCSQVRDRGYGEQLRRTGLTRCSASGPRSMS